MLTIMLWNTVDITKYKIIIFDVNFLGELENNESFP